MLTDWLTGRLAGWLIHVRVGTHKLMFNMAGPLTVCATGMWQRRRSEVP